MLVIFCIAQRTAFLFEQCWRAKYCFVIPAIATLSTLWSQDPSRTLLKGLCLFLVAVFAVYLVNRYDNEEIIHLFYLLSNIILVLSFMYSLVFHGTGITPDGAWRGVFHTKNDAARVVVFLLPSALYYRPRVASAETFRQASICATFVFALLTRSVTGLASAALLILLFALWTLIRRVAATEKGIIVTLAVFAAVTLSFLVFYYAKDVLPLFGKDITLTGRTKIWSSVLLSIAKRPWLGYGHGAFWIGQGEATNTYLAANWTVSYAHNGFLDVLLQLGFVGLAAVCFVFAKAVIDTAAVISRVTSRYSFWCVSILALTLTFNLDEGTFISEERIYWLLFLVVALGVHGPNRRHAQEAGQFAEEALYQIETIR
jgi:O-antigen ligase